MKFNQNELILIRFCFGRKRSEVTFGTNPHFMIELLPFFLARKSVLFWKAKKKEQEHILFRHLLQWGKRSSYFEFRRYFIAFRLLDIFFFLVFSSFFSFLAVNCAQFHKISLTVYAFLILLQIRSHENRTQCFKYPGNAFKSTSLLCASRLIEHSHSHQELNIYLFENGCCAC